ncbi:DUF3300 domain-containing protein [Burkholderia glumae]|uniref:DUF3300 domain-containing protein n=1 Tax=Burkholderia glumae TaxID=337 RepID=UPI0020B3D1E9|nr:DUF3300 domain-containing protein [Burkholderia glumae]MCQ0032630.1 DUF3300 domain-containing protein [Burkholderia glumae]MCQ0037690.1 DUF3300 domain-containing protein [Burkholderia glumae]
MNDTHQIMKPTLPPRHHSVRALVASSLVIALLGLAACNKKSDDTPPAASEASAASAPAASDAQPAPAAYTPPSADQLYQMVAPIALFPDKLVALVLAGSTYPDQITAANTWIGQNPTLKGADLTAAADAQSWDPSVKALTAFPAVLSQMAGNIAWTTALGQAYFHDPNDVLNAIQVMRQRAQKAGHLSSGSKLHVTQVTQAAPPPSYTPAPSGPAIYEGPPIVPPPPQTIVIEPAQPDTVYVPTYNPAVVYGAPVVYPGYVYRPSYDTGAVVTAGVLSFGVGIAVGALFSHHDWGWHAWGVNWGAPHPDGPAWGNWQRPAVVYNHTTYISKSTTVINNVNNIHNTRITNNVTNNYGNTTNNVGNLINRGAPPAGMAAAQQMREQQMREQQMRAQQMREQQAARANPGAPHPVPSAMSMPHFGANDARPGERPGLHPGESRPNQFAAHTGTGASHPGAEMHAGHNEPGAHAPVAGRAEESVPHPPAEATHGQSHQNEMREMSGMQPHQQAETRHAPEAEASRPQHEAPPQQHQAFPQQQQHEAEAHREAPQSHPAEHGQHAPQAHPQSHPQHSAPHPQQHERREHR